MTLQRKTTRRTRLKDIFFDDDELDDVPEAADEDFSMVDLIRQELDNLGKRATGADE